MPSVLAEENAAGLSGGSFRFSLRQRATSNHLPIPGGGFAAAGERRGETRA